MGDFHGIFTCHHETFLSKYPFGWFAVSGLLGLERDSRIQKTCVSHAVTRARTIVKKHPFKSYCFSLVGGFLGNLKFARAVRYMRVFIRFMLVA